MVNTNTPYYLTATGLFLLLKFGYTLADTAQLAFLLQPTDQLVGLLTGSSSEYLTGEGYYHDRLNVLIDKSCAGFNFWVLCFLVFTYLACKYLKRPFHKALSIPSALVCAYFLTLFVNASRIFAAIVVQNQTRSGWPDQQHLLHEAVGIITYLSFLILTYYLVERLFIQLQHHAKLT